MRRSTSWYFRLTLTGILLAVLFVTTTSLTVHAQVKAPQSDTTHQVRSMQNSGVPKNSIIKVNKQGEIVFSPDHVSCYAQYMCIEITNIQGQTVALYLNGKFIENLTPGEESGTLFNFPGTDTFTIPNTNPNTQLTVTVKPYIVPNTNLKTNKSGAIVFSPQKLACKFFEESSCFSITNTTTMTMSVYLNGTFSFTVYPNQVYNVDLNGPGTYIFTIPNTNPNAKLTVIAK